MKHNSANTKSYSFSLPLILLITFCIYIPALQNNFTNWDDDIYILNNPHIKELNHENFKFIFTQYFYGNYHPLTLLVYAFEYFLAGDKPGLYHLVNILLHVFNTFLVFKIIKSLFNSQTVAFVASLLFGIHTLHVESVAWVSETKDVLYSAFYLLALLYYLKFTRLSARFIHTPALRHPGTPNHFPLFALSLLFFILSLLSKAQAVTLAPTLILIDYLMGRKWHSWKCLAEKIPFFIASLIIGIIALDAQTSGKAIRIDLHIELYQRFLVACYGFVQYLTKLLLPVHLSAIYPYPKGTGFVFWLYPVPVIIFFILSMLHFSKYRQWVFGIFFFTVNILPVLQIIPVGNTIIADRYSYIPSIGIFLLPALLYSSITGSFVTRKEVSTVKIKPGFLKKIFFIYIIFLSILTIARNRTWKDSLSLWNDVLSKYPDVSEALNNRATVKRLAGDFSGAAADYNRALQINPSFEMAYYNRGLLNYYSKDYEAAISDFSEAIKHKPDYSDAFSNRGLCYAKQNNFDFAISDFTKAIEFNNRDPFSFFNRGFAYYHKAGFSSSVNDFNNAVSDFTRAIELSPSMGGAFLFRGLSKIFLKKRNEGCSDIRTAMQLGAPDANAEYQKYCIP